MTQGNTSTYVNDLTKLYNNNYESVSGSGFETSHYTY